MADKLFDFRWGNIDLFRSEEMQLVQVRGAQLPTKSIFRAAAGLAVLV